MKPKFSVIVPIYKVEDFLSQCIESILNQTYANFELLLVDDGSPDNCPKICDEYAKKDERIKVIHKENGGLVSARNIGIKNASGDYILYVDGDDWIIPETLTDLNEILENNQEPDMVIFGIEKVYKDHKEKVPFYPEEGFYNTERLEKEVFPYCIYDNRKSFCKGYVFPAACNKLYKRQLLEEHHCVDERIKMGEDNAFVYECLLHSKKVYFKNKVYYEYIQLNETSFANRYDENRFKNNKILVDYMNQRIGNLNENLSYQMNAFKVYWLFMAVFHEVKCKRKLFTARKHIRREIKLNSSTKDIKMKSLPKSAKCYLLLLKLHMYALALIGAKILKNHN